MLKEKFLEYYKAERNCSALTVESYRNDLSGFQTFFESLNEDIQWTTVDEDIIREWIIYLLDNEKMATSTVNRKISALKSFYHYLMKTGDIQHNPTLRIVGPKKKKTLPTFIKETEMDQLIDLLDQDQSYEGILSKTAIMMLYLTGMRRAELLSLQDKDIDHIQKQVKVTGKRNKQRIIPYGPELESCIQTYTQARDQLLEGQQAERFFINPKGKPLNENAIETIVKRNLTKVTTQKKRSPHVLRHTFATAMLNNNADIASIQKLLGHSNLNTTQVYTHVSFEELKKTYQNAHPRS